MKILRLTLTNFKGIKDFTLDTQGGNVSIYADNALGKTTIYDGFLWLLFEKDSQNRKDFEIKTLDSSGQPIHGLDHSVEGVFDIGGKTLTLKKTYSEQWTKKRGSAQKTFTGHTVDHSINGVPVKRGEYTSKISELVDEGTFKLLTNPIYFCEILHWKGRRDILMEVCGDLTDQEVIDSDKALAELPGILGARKLEEHRRVIAARRSEINRELEKIPVRIDEATRSLPDITGIDAFSVRLLADKAREAIGEKQQQIARIMGGGELAEKHKALREAEGELLDLRNSHRAKYDTKAREKDAELRQAQVNVNDLKIVIAALEKKQAQLDKDAAEIEELLPKLREDWRRITDMEFTFEQDDKCPTCGQWLPQEQLDEAREKALAAFNRMKAEDLEAINTRGKKHRESLTAISADATGVVNEIAMARADLEKAELVASDLHTELQILIQQMEHYATGPYKVKQQEIQTLQQAITSLKGGRSVEVDAIQGDISYLEREIGQANAQLLDLDRYNKGQARIEELAAQEKALAAEYERLEREQYLADQFTRAKVALLEERINSRFKLARFKMFRELVNGGIEECCETLFNGVPYSGGLNNAARINTGLDIINTLAEHYGFSPPVFIDNAEAVTGLIETRGQQIRLVVSERDKALRVEIEAKQIKEAV